MSIVDRNLKQTVTVWVTGAPNGYGGFAFSAPTTQNGRWTDRAVLFLSDMGEQEVSNAVVHFTTDVNVGDYVALGDLTAHADPMAIDNAFRIKRFNKIPDLRANVMLRKAFV